ncbi:MAG: hypothetical protein M3Z04_08735 [Chloroflexota bacterium]|nr:hypothetical protein [Chloroflexota bacterium]
MDEPFDRQIVLLSAVQPGLGQLASGHTERGLILIALDLVFSAVSGVLSTLLKVLTFGRRPIKALPDRLNPLALIWLAIYLYNLYDAYNIAAGADDDDADLLDYEEYTPGDTAEAYSAQAGSADLAAGHGTAVPPPSSAALAVTPVVADSPASASGPATDSALSSTSASDHTNGSAPADTLPSVMGQDAGADQATTADQATAMTPLHSQAAGDTDQTTTAPLAHNQSDMDTTADQATDASNSVAAEVAALQAMGDGSAAGPGASRDTVAIRPPANRAAPLNLGESDLDWAVGVSKAQLMDALGDDRQVIGTFGNYLPSDRLFHSIDEAMDLIPEQAWQDAQGHTWTGADIPDGEEPSGYRDSAAGRMPAGDTTA